MRHNTLQTPVSLQEAMMEILEYERQRVSLDLHDRVQNKLRLLRDKCVNTSYYDPIQEILEEIRSVAHQLVPKKLQEFSLKDYLNIYETQLNQLYGHIFKTDYRTNIEILVPKSIEIHLFSMVQECLNNVLRHALNTPVLFIRYRQEADSLVLIVEDFGNGFDYEEARKKATLGLKSLETRCHFIGAALSITAKPNEGCKIKIAIPLEILQNHKEDTTPYSHAIGERLEESPKKKYILPSEIRRILIVDNQIEYGTYINTLLSDYAPTIEVIYLSSVAKAKTYLQETPTKIDVVITDITMPEESGIQLVEFMKKEHPDIDIIIYTINDSPTYIFRAVKQLNIKHYIWKDQSHFEKHPLLEALENLGKDFHSPEIQKLIDSFELKKYDPKHDSKYRDVFKRYMKYLKEGDKYAEIEQKVRRELNLSVDDKTIDRYFRTHKTQIGFNNDSELNHLLIRISTDFGLID